MGCKEKGKKPPKRIIKLLSRLADFGEKAGVEYNVVVKYTDASEESAAKQKAANHIAKLARKIKRREGKRMVGREWFRLPPDDCAVGYLGAAVWMA